MMRAPSTAAAGLSDAGAVTAASDTAVVDAGSDGLPQALNAINPWGGEEGGFANAAAQGNWDVGELLPWF